MIVDVLQGLVYGIIKALSLEVDFLIFIDLVFLFRSLRCIQGPNFGFFNIATKKVLQARRSRDDHITARV